MVIYIATVLAKAGHEEQVTKFYQDLEPLMREAKGYRGRQILQPKDDGSPGARVAEVSTVLVGAGVGTHTVSIKSDKKATSSTAPSPVIPPAFQRLGKPVPSG